MGDAWQINTAGIVYRDRKIQPATSTPLPVVDLRGEYRGPLLPLGCAEDCKGCDPLPEGACDCPLCWDGQAPPHVPNTERLVADLVCYTFHGPPPDGVVASTVFYIDGDTGNCHADNVRWVRDEVRDTWLDKQKIRRLMRPGLLAPYVVRDSRASPRAERIYTDSNGLPVTPLKETA